MGQKYPDAKKEIVGEGFRPQDLKINVMTVVLPGVYSFLFLIF